MAQSVDTNDVKGEKITRGSRPWHGLLPSGLLYVVLGGLVLLPVAFIVYGAFINEDPTSSVSASAWTLHSIRLLGTSGVLHAILNSVIVALAGTIIALVIGGGLAYLSTRTDIPLRPLIQLAGTVPLFMSTFIAAISWTTLAAPKTGYLNLVLETLHIPFDFNIYSLTGIIFVFGIYYAPYAYLFLYGAFSILGADLEEAARVHGASTRVAFFHAALPIVRPAIYAAGLLSFALMLENFPVPSVLGTPARVNLVPSLIYLLMHQAPPASNEAAALGLALLILVIGILALQRRLLSHSVYTSVSGKGLRTARTRLGRWKAPVLVVVCLYFLFAIILPFAALLITALRKSPYVSSLKGLVAPHNLSGEIFGQVWDVDLFQVGLRNIIIIAILVALIGMVLYSGLAYVVHRSRLPGRSGFEYVAVGPAAIPAIVLSLGFLWGWSWISSWSGFALFGTLWILIVAYVVRFMPQGYSSVIASIRQIDPELEEAARVSGAGPFRTAMSVTLPLIRSGVVGAAILAAIMSIRELSIAIFLYTTQTTVLSIAIYNFFISGQLRVAAGSAVLYSVLLAFVAILGRKALLGSGSAR